MRNNIASQLSLLSVVIFIAPAVFYLYEFFLRVAPSAMFSNLMADFSINATQLGVLTSSFFISYSLFQFPAGALLDRFGPRKLIALATLVCSLGTYLFATTHSFHDVIIARLMIGTASAFAFIGCMKVITVWFPKKLFPIFAGLTLTLGSIGAMSAEAPISIVLQHTDWRTLMLWASGFGLILCIYIFLIVRDHNPAQPEASDHQKDEAFKNISFMQLLLKVIKNPQNWLVAFYGLLVTAPIDAFGGLWGVPYLVHGRNMDHVLAATLVSMTFLGMAIGSPLLGWISNVLKSRKKAMYLSSSLAFISLCCIIYLPNLNAFFTGVFFFLFGAGGTFVLSFTVISDINPPALVATASGFINMFANLGSASFQPFIGHLLDKFWDGSIVNGLNVYHIHDFRIGLAILPISYLLCLLIFIPKIAESFK